MIIVAGDDAERKGEEEKRRRKLDVFSSFLFFSLSALPSRDTARP
jgi:hypothetical protein